MTDPETPDVPYWHLYTDADGVSRQTRCAMTAFERSSISPPAEPQWIGAKTHEPSTVFVTVLPPGWIGAWHENPKPQWIVPLSGSWFVESMDGQRVTMGPGELSFGEDQGTKSDGERKGHRSGTVGDAPAVLMIVQFEHPVVDSPCRFR